jgi:hypothetical protein
MKAGLVLACAASGGALMMHGTATSPYAVIGVTDEIITPGQVVRVIAGCADPAFVRSRIISPVLAAPDLVRESNDPAAALFSSGKIADDAKPGTYPISFTCVDREIKNEFTVVAATGKPVPVTSSRAPDPGLSEEAPGDNSDGLLVRAVTLVAAGSAGVLALRRHRRARREV